MSNNRSKNLIELRVLVDELEKMESSNINPKNDTLQEIKCIINDEQEVINKLDKDSKVKRYETVCSTILSLISATNI
jgi:hypothetical protein